MWGMLILLYFCWGTSGLQDFAKYLTPSIGAMNACLAIHNQFYGKKIQKVVCISIITQNKTKCLCFVPFGSFSGFWAFDQQSMTLSDANLSIFSKLVQSTPQKKKKHPFPTANFHPSTFTNKQKNNQKRWICGDTNDRFQEQQSINSWWTHWFLLQPDRGEFLEIPVPDNRTRFPNQNRCFQKTREKS